MEIPGWGRMPVTASNDATLQQYYAPLGKIKCALRRVRVIHNNDLARLSGQGGYLRHCHHVERHRHAHCGHYACKVVVSARIDAVNRISFGIEIFVQGKRISVVSLLCIHTPEWIAPPRFLRDLVRNPNAGLVFAGDFS